jgi:chromosomal replication initiator protein
MNELDPGDPQGKTFEFRARYRTVDVLLIDDIQFPVRARVVRRKSSSTRSTTCTPAASSSSSPATGRRKEIDSLEERLLSRFESGLITDLTPPDFETRVAILRKKGRDGRA